MELVREVGAWMAVVVLTGLAVILGVREELRARARRRSVVAGREVRYGSGDRYRPRSALWSGLLLLWIAVSLAAILPLAGLFPPRWQPAGITAVLAATVLAFVVALRFLIDHARTEVVEGTVLERKILYSGEDNSTKGYWIAVEDGRRGRIDGTPVGPDDYARVVTGARVRVHLTPRGRQVKRLEVLTLPGPAGGTTAEGLPIPPVGGAPVSGATTGSATTGGATIGRLPIGPAGGVSAAGLAISPAQAARALRSPVQVVPVAAEVPNTRRYIYVPPGIRVIDGLALSPALHVTEAFDPEAADEVARRATAGGRRTWHHGRRGVFQTGMTYILTWGDGALLLRGQVPADDLDEIGRLAHSLKPPGAGRG